MADPIDPKTEEILEQTSGEEMENVETGYMGEQPGEQKPADWEQRALEQRVREGYTTGKVSPFVEGTFNPADANPNMPSTPTRSELKQQYIDRQQGNTTLKPK